MSIENTFERIAVALEELTKTVQGTINPVISVSPATPEQPAAVPSGAITNDPTPVTLSPQMPPPSSYTPTPVVQPAVTAQPFPDVQGLVTYVMQAYSAMGAEKGAGIQTVLANLGYDNINNVAPSHFAAMKQGIDALMVS